MSEDFQNLSVDAIEELIAKTADILKQATEVFNEKQEKVTEVQKELEPVVKKYRELSAEKTKLENTMKQLKPEIQASRKKLEDLRHWLSNAKLRRLEAEEFDKLASELDTLTISMPWREFAYSHQIEGAKRLALTGGKAILGDKRGLGKTLTSLITCDMLKSKKIIIFAPKETLENFEDEIKNWAPHRTLVSLISQPKNKRDILLTVLPKTDEWLVTVNLEAWRRDKNFIQQLVKLQADTVIIDEAHFIKDHNSVTAQGVKDVVHAQNMCALCGENSLADTGKIFKCITKGCPAEYQRFDENSMSVKHCIPMTGTPILNNPGDMFSLLNLIDEANFRHKTDFLKRYCEHLGGNRYSFAFGGEKALVKKLGPRLIQRDRKTAGVIIPPQKIQFYNLEFDKEKYADQYQAYHALNEQWIIFSDSHPEIQQMSVQRKITHILRLRQMLTWPMGIKWKDPLTNGIIFQCDVNQSLKVDWTLEKIQQFVEEGERVVLFSQFVPPVEELARRLEKTPIDSYGGRMIKPVILNGSASRSIRDQVRYDFDARNDSNEYDVVLAHYRVGGQSLNFTAATQMIILDEEWNPGKNDQAYGRIDRLGQTRETTVHIPLVENTVDTFMRKLNKLKADIIDGFESELNLGNLMREAIENGEL